MRSLALIIVLSLSGCSTPPTQDTPDDTPLFCGPRSEWAAPSLSYWLVCKKLKSQP